MMLKNLMGAAAAVGLLTMTAGMPAAHAQSAPGEQMITNGPQSSGVEQSGGWSAQQNVKESEQYDRLVEANPGFRHARMRKECGPITDAQLQEQCIGSFNRDEPAYGSSTPPRHHNYRSNSGG
jgi:hypothetical protein